MEHRQNFVSVGVGLHFGEDSSDLSRLIDDVGDTVGAHILFAVHAFFAPGPIGFDEALIGISQQRERQIILLDECFVGFLAVDADAEDFDVELAKLSKVIAEGTCFLGAPGGVVFRIKIENHLLALEVAERMCLPILVGRRELRCLRAHR